LFYLYLYLYSFLYGSDLTVVPSTQFVFVSELVHVSH
jgi:hypothetical protein